MLQTYAVMYPSISTLQDAAPVSGWQLHLLPLYNDSSGLLLIGPDRWTSGVSIC
jgi:hypothetical protein